MPCVICDNTGWVCEGHGNHPWRGVSNRPDSCDFGPGMPCPSSTCEHSLDRCDGDDNAALRADNERLRAENEAIIAANRDGLLHWDVLKADYEQLRAALEAILSGPRDADKSYAELFVEVCCEIRAAIAAQPAPSPWRPIETAPKDGTQFLTWDSHYGIRVGRCVVRPDHDDWLSYMDAYKGSSKGGIRATHWMPLPLAPKEVE